ncbi:hypothetical protein TIFTF001_009705 [Ficus carica]|uniref:Uncharacterized protein n=1 Tax=Ficus carica TaxID=3494 RepID=A0AA88D1J5_FICCA|nr:hypothetical protein TIFTF001_009705 [Ficus carica]
MLTTWSWCSKSIKISSRSSNFGSHAVVVTPSSTRPGSLVWNGSRVVVRHVGYRRDVHVVNHRPHDGCQTVEEYALNADRIWFPNPAHEVNFPYLALLTCQSPTNHSAVVQESLWGLLSGMSPSRLVLSIGLSRDTCTVRDEV